MSKFIPVDSEDPMDTLCRMVSHTSYEDLPDRVIEYAKYSILDTIAVTIGGSAMDGVLEIVNFVRSKGGKTDSFIPFYGGKVPASEAGMVLGTMARAMDLGQVHEEAGHCSEYIVPTLLAAVGLKKKVSGKEFITAFVIGQEVLLRIGVAFKSVSQALPSGRGGGHYIFGAVAAAGKLLGLNCDELANAEGIARCKTQPHDIANATPATLMVRVHHGFICHDAIECCLLANRGITGPRQEVLTGTKGYLGLANWETDPGAIEDELGEKWELLNVVMKPYAACKCTHTAAGGIIDQMTVYDFGADDIAAIDIDESSTNWNLVCLPREAKWHPQTVAECQFSLPYVVAIAAYTQNVSMASYTQDARSRRDVRNLMTRISARYDTNLPPWAARVTTKLKNGRRYSEKYVHIKGHPKNPFTETELVQKFKKCVPYSVYGLDTKVVDSLVETLLNLEKVDDIEHALILPLTPRKSPE